MSMDAFERKELFDKVRWFARYPDNEAKRFKRYVINGLKFRTKDFETTRKTQNSGVCVVTESGVTYYDDDEEVDTYMENVHYNVTTKDACDDANDNHASAQVDEEGTIYDAPLISEDK
ncbi:hypothetical protein SO802_017615 [Lithocarpus litseifolius]|uniref:Uncharacterized protein n=1 Tax=Lithocarpus litseifolius TaxID=425828 RepID=A0AAW2CKV5_9ROSI